jgi:hypothetical protein
MNYQGDLVTGLFAAGVKHACGTSHTAAKYHQQNAFDHMGWPFPAIHQVSHSTSMLTISPYTDTGQHH